MTNQFTTPVAGANVAVSSALAPFTDMPVGTVVADKGGVFVKVSITETVEIGQVLVIDNAWAALLASLTTTAPTAYGSLCGVAVVAGTTGQQMWLQIWGAGFALLLANAAAGADLNSTGTDGDLDDDHTAGSEKIAGIIATTANGGSTALTAVRINWPTVSTTY